jgi:8-oxo-dGTP diphosphatase
MILESKTPTLKRLRVVAAIIRDGEYIFSAERDYGFLKGKWEFPGGKIKEGESPEAALIREIKEELDTTIVIDSFFMNIIYNYPDFTLDMDVFNCHVKQGKPVVEKGIHSASSWKKISELKAEDWCPADGLVVAKLIKN